MKKLTREQILMLHAQLINQTGGSNGVRDYSLLESAIESPFQSFDGEELYPTIQSKAARLGFCLSELLRLIEVGASCFNHYCIGYDDT